MNPLVRIAGVDEAGRGCLAGPVFAAAVILDGSKPISGLNDSKKLTALARARLRIVIERDALAWAVAQATACEIDTHNILQASLLAMQRAVTALKHTPMQVWVDGNIAPRLTIECKTFVGGDALHDCISAASILAKEHRDEAMVRLDREHPGYGFAAHKGYGTAQHLKALENHGVIPNLHRMSFAPCAHAKNVL